MRAVAWIVALAVLGGLWWFARRGTHGFGSGVVVQARTGLTRSAVLAVIAVDGRRYLVGASDNGVNLLTELAPHEAVPDDPNGPGMGLVERLQRMTLRSSASGTSHELP